MAWCEKTTRTVGAKRLASFGPVSAALSSVCFIYRVVFLSPSVYITSHAVMVAKRAYCVKCRLRVGISVRIVTWRQIKLFIKEHNITCRLLRRTNAIQLKCRKWYQINHIKSNSMYDIGIKVWNTKWKHSKTSQ